jgi:hypothetical protein
MKSKTVIWILAILMLPLAASAQWDRINLVGTVGMATGNTEKMIVNLGIEIEVFRYFYAQVSFDNFFDWDSMTGYYSRDGRTWISPRIRTRVFGMNLLGAFKFPLSWQCALFAKAGIAYTFRSRYSNDNYYYDGFGDYWYGGYNDYYPSSEDESPMRTGLAYALGTGIEYRLNERLALTGGGTYESLFDQTPASGENGEHGNWVKLYVGFSYCID